ncbi:MAG: response regulator, partial [Myxococcales bacterium]|nr:response regulator [Myxococcales bacterium]
MHHNPIKAMVVDDSAFMRQLISDVLRSDPGIEVVATASDPYQARDLIKQYNPDVLTLDVEMPKMDGLKFLENLMRLRPMPVVMVSSLTEAGARTTMEALALGAVDFFPKPKTDVERTFETVAAELIEKVRHAASARVRQRAPTLAPSESKAAGVVLPAPRPGVRRPDSGRLIAIGASTGGTEAIREVLQQLPADMPPVVIAQHIPSGFSLAFAQRLDRVCQLAVSEVKDGETLQP